MEFHHCAEPQKKYFSHRFTEDVVQQIFNWILNEINDAGYLSPKAVFIDGTHIKANASMKKAIRRAMPEASKICCHES